MSTDENKLNKHFKLMIFILTAGLGILMLVMLTVGRYHICLSDMFSILSDRLTGNITEGQSGLVQNPSRSYDINAANVLLNIRLPRVILSVMVGAALSLAGCTYQSIFCNPMASPDVLGASTGACFGAALAILLDFNGAGITISAFVFSLLTIILVFALSLKSGGSKITSLILIGIMVSSLFSAATSYIELIADPAVKLPAITYWMMGSLSGASVSEVVQSFVFMIIPGLLLFMLRWRINLLTLPEDEAESLGVNVKALRYICIVLSSLLTASCVAVSGLVGWVGLVIPNVARMIFGSNTKRTIPLSILMGGIFLLLVDTLARTLLAVEIPIGIITSFLGAPFFILLLFKEGKSK